MGDSSVDQLFEGYLGFDLVVKDWFWDIAELDDNVFTAVLDEVASFDLDKSEVGCFRGVVLKVFPELSFGASDLLAAENDEDLFVENTGVAHFKDVLDG